MDNIDRVVDIFIKIRFAVVVVVMFIVVQSLFARQACRQVVRQSFSNIGLMSILRFLYVAFRTCWNTRQNFISIDYMWEMSILLSPHPLSPNTSKYPVRCTRCMYIRRFFCISQGNIVSKVNCLNICPAILLQAKIVYGGKEFGRKVNITK